MKKILSLILIGFLCLTLVGCESNTDDKENQNNDNSNSNSDKSENKNSEQKAVLTLIDWMKEGTFSYDYTVTTTSDGETVTASGSMAVDKENYAITSTSDTSKVRIVNIDGKTYMIEETSKIIMTMPEGEESELGVPTEYNNMVKVGDGTGTVNGKNLPYEEYTEGEYKMKIYLENNVVYAIESTGEGVTSLMIITNAKKTVPSGAFDIPTTGYTKY